MVVAFILFILLISVLLAWKGNRQTSIVLFSISIILSTGWFIHHITNAVGISL